MTQQALRIASLLYNQERLHPYRGTGQQHVSCFQRTAPTHGYAVAEDFKPAPQPDLRAAWPHVSNGECDQPSSFDNRQKNSHETSMMLKGIHKELS